MRNCTYAHSIHIHIHPSPLNLFYQFYLHFTSDRAFICCLVLLAPFSQPRGSMTAEGKLPLLDKLYYEDCSGCRIEKRKQTQPTVPFKTLFSVWMIVLSSALPISSLFPFLYFMIKDFQIAEREEDTSYYAGYVGSAFMFGRALTSVFWGVLADRYGRKPVIVIGTFAVVVFNTLFGLSVNFWMAIISRFLLGSLNGLLGPVKAYATEVCREEHQALGLSVTSTAWSIGLVIGPAVGGLLAQPAEKYPNIFSKESIYGRFPYFLPCLCISVFALAVSFSSFWLEESLHNHPVRTSRGDSYEGLEAETCHSSSKKSLLRNWPLMSSIFVYCIFALVDMAYGEIFSLWAVSPRSLGGLSYSTDDVGAILSVTGFGMLVYQFFGYPYLDRVFGPITTARIASILSLPIFESYPFIGLLSGLSLTLTLNFASVIKNILSTSIITSTFILQNRAVDQDQRGAANGIAITLMSLSRTIGPAGGGAVLSWAQKRRDASFLPGTHMVFFLLSVIQFIGFSSTFRPFLVAR